MSLPLIALVIVIFVGAVIGILYDMNRSEDYRMWWNFQCPFCQSIEKTDIVNIEEMKALHADFMRRHNKCLQERTGP